MRNATGVVRDEARANWGWVRDAPGRNLILLVRADDVRMRGGREHRKHRERARFRVERARDPDREWVPRDDDSARAPTGPLGKTIFVVARARASIGTFREILPRANTLRRARMSGGGDARGDASAALDAERRLWNPAVDDASVPLIGEFKTPGETPRPRDARLAGSRRASRDEADHARPPGRPRRPSRGRRHVFRALRRLAAQRERSGGVGTRRESEPHQVILGADHARDPKRRHLVGVAACLRTMRPGERALFTVPPSSHTAPKATSPSPPSRPIAL